MKECVLIRKEDIDSALATSPVPGKRALEPLGSLAQQKGVPVGILEDHQVSEGAAELHRTKADLFFCLQGSATFTYGGILVNPRQIQGSDEDVTGDEITGGQEAVLNAGDWLWIPANQPHAHAAQGTARLFLIKIPMA